MLIVHLIVCDRDVSDLLNYLLCCSDKSQFVCLLQGIIMPSHYNYLIG